MSKFHAGNGRNIVRASVAAAIGAASLIGFSTQAIAAEAGDDELLVDELAEVQVTGTRIQNNPNVTSANPITSVTGEEMRQLGIVNVADALTLLVPQNISSYMPGMTGDDQSGFGGGGMDSMDRGSFFVGQTIANLRGMDPAFGSRTLTMVDGRRMVSSSNQADVVDMNIIPSNLLQRMDVVTGGASATYGSGAMAGVVNLVLNNRMQGVNVDLSYGVNEAGDGSSPNVSISGGRSFFGGRGHGLLSLEWQDTSAIRDCAAARNWCAESRTLFTNSAGSTQDVTGVLNPLEGYQGLPARFEMANYRRQQFSPNGAVHHANSQLTSGYRFTDDGFGVEEYAYGYRGGTGQSALGGDGPLVTQDTVLRPSSERRTMFTNFEYNLTERTTAYLQANYSETESDNRNGYTTGNYCVRFNNTGTNAVVGGEANPGTVVVYGGGGIGATVVATGLPYESTSQQRSPVHTVANFRSYLGIPTAAGFTNGGNNAPWWYPVEVYGESPPNFDFNGLATGSWLRVSLNNPQQYGTEYWVLETITLHDDVEGFNDPGTPPVMPGLGRNAYPFLYSLSPEALYEMQRVFGSAGGTYGALQNPTTGALLGGFASTTGGGAQTGLDTLYGPNACGGHTVVRKVWDQQVQRWTNSTSDSGRILTGIKGRFGGDWRWDAYYQYGSTSSKSLQTNVQTNLRMAMAMDSVVDDRVDSPTYGMPICRIHRDGPPLLDWEGLPVSSPEDLTALADGCVPINVFGNHYNTPWESPVGDVVLTAEQRNAMQQQAVDFAFVDSVSRGKTSLQVLSFDTSGSLWQGWGHGPLTGAFGIEVRENRTNNKGTEGLNTVYERADLASVWSDGYSGKSRITEGFTELNMPLVSGLEGINLLSANIGARYSSYYNKGGMGTTGASATQGTFNWKFSTVYEPFDFVRFRLTRSRDLRAAGYRDLFLNQPSQPDQYSGRNPWRERSAFSTENQQERWGQVRVGNPELKTEKSNTLTVGTVLSPGGWAQGMRVSVDYFTISVTDAINTSFRSGNPIVACWEESGNSNPQYFDDGEIDPNFPGMNGLLDTSLDSCRDIVFGTNVDGTPNLQDIVSYNSARPENSLPIQRRGIDVAWSYSFPLNRVFESLPGSVSLTVRGTRALEASGIQVISFSNVQNQQFGFNANNPDHLVTNFCTVRGGTLELGDERTGGMQGGNCFLPVDMVGQIRSSVFVPGVSASPKWTGNIITSYRVRDLSASLSARYIGGSVMDKSWTDDPESPLFMNELGQYLNGSIDNNWVKPYVNFSLNGSYDLRVGNMKQFQVFGSVSNLFDKSPPFTGGGISGASAQYHDTYGRAYRMGVRMRF